MINSIEIAARFLHAFETFTLDVDLAFAGEGEAGGHGGGLLGGV